MLDFGKIMSMVSLATTLGPDLVKFMDDVQVVCKQYLEPDMALVIKDATKVKGDIEVVLNKYLLPDVAKVRDDIHTALGLK